MSDLTVTVIDVGWGDSILIESVDEQGKTRYALIDSNDTSQRKSSFIFLKKFFDRKGIDPKHNRPIFDFIILSHAHADHGQGLKAIMRHFGTRDFWYSKSSDWGSLLDLIRYAKRSNSRVSRHQAIDSSKQLPSFGNVEMAVLWPPKDYVDRDNENNNSIVLALTLGKRTFVLTGDAEKEVWDRIADKIPRGTRFFKVPHHGSRDSTLSGSRPLWLNHLSMQAVLGISSHVKPYRHPHPRVVDLFEENNRRYFRTDLHYHLTFQTDGKRRTASVKYSH